MFARRRSKAWIANRCLLCVALAYSCSTAGLQSLANWAESHHGAYPYWGAESSFRYLLPTLFGPSTKSKLLLMGPSKSQEGFLHEDFQAEFTEYDVRHGAFAGATMDEMLVALEYLKSAHGPASLPRILVVGVDRHVIGNFPRRFGRRGDPNEISFLFDAIRNHSGHATAVLTAKGGSLRAKGWSERIVAWGRFMASKQQPRYRAALSRLIDIGINGVDGRELDVPALPEPERALPGGWHRSPLHAKNLLTWRSYFGRVGIWNALRRWSREFGSPYHIRYTPRITLDSIALWTASLGERDLAGDASWFGGFSWNPRSDEEMIREQVDRLNGFCANEEIELYVVNLPEHRLLRSVQSPEYYDDYLRIVRQHVPADRWIDAGRDFEDADFVDATHLSPAAARKLSLRIIEYIKRDDTSFNHPGAAEAGLE